LADILGDAQEADAEMAEEEWEERMSEKGKVEEDIDRESVKREGFWILRITKLMIGEHEEALNEFTIRQGLIVLSGKNWTRVVKKSVRIYKATEIKGTESQEPLSRYLKHIIEMSSPAPLTQKPFSHIPLALWHFLSLTRLYLLLVQAIHTASQHHRTPVFLLQDAPNPPRRVIRFHPETRNLIRSPFRTSTKEPPKINYERKVTKFVHMQLNPSR
jgi:hypothetical protein